MQSNAISSETEFFPQNSVSFFRNPVGLTEWTTRDQMSE